MRSMILLCAFGLLCLASADHLMRCYVTSREHGDSSDHGHSHGRRLFAHLPPEVRESEFKAREDMGNFYAACAMLYIDHLDPCNEWDSDNPDRCVDSDHGGHGHSHAVPSAASADTAEIVPHHASHDHGGHDGEGVNINGFVHIGVEELGNLNCRWDDTEAATRTFRQKAEEAVNHMLKEEGVHDMTAHFEHKDIIGACCNHGNYCNDDLTSVGVKLSISSAAALVPKALALAGLATLTLFLAL